MSPDDTLGPMPHAQTLKEVFHVAGDAPDPRGGDLRGVAAGYDLTRSALGRPMLHYRLPDGTELVLEADVYAMPEQPIYVLMLCPRCLAGGRQNALRIVQGAKAMVYEPAAAVPPFPGWTQEQMAHAFPHGAGGLLSVEAFGCTWEETPELRRDFGMSVCGWRVAIDKNVVRDA